MNSRKVSLKITSHVRNVHFSFNWVHVWKANNSQSFITEVVKSWTVAAFIHFEAIFYRIKVCARAFATESEVIFVSMDVIPLSRILKFSCCVIWLLYFSVNYPFHIKALENWSFWTFWWQILTLNLKWTKSDQNKRKNFENHW